MAGPLFDDEFMNDMLLNPDLYGMEENERVRDDDEDEENEDDD